MIPPAPLFPPAPGAFAARGGAGDAAKAADRLGSQPGFRRRSPFPQRSAGRTGQVMGSGRPRRAGPGHQDAGSGQGAAGRLGTRSFFLRTARAPSPGVSAGKS